MPHYHFNVRDGSSFPDAEGTDLPDLKAARVAAVKLAGALLLDCSQQLWNGEEWRVEVTDPAGLILFQLDFTGTDSPAVMLVALPTAST